MKLRIPIFLIALLLLSPFFTASPLAAATVLFDLVIEPAAMMGSNSANGTVFLDSPAPTGGALVTLTSSRPDILQVPASVTVPEGAAQTSFTLNSVLVPAYVNGTVSASYDGKTIEKPFSVAPINVEYAQVYPERIAGGANAKFSVFVTGAPGGEGIEVELSSSNPEVAPLPTSGIISAGNEWAEFSVATSRVKTSTTITLSGTFAGESVSAELEVVPASELALDALGMEEFGIEGGTSTVGWAMLDGGAPANGSTVTLLSSNPEIVQVPETVFIPAGEEMASFPVSTSKVSRFTDVTLFATWRAQTVTADLTVMSPIEDFNFDPGYVTGGGQANGNLLLSVPASDEGAVVNLTSSDPSLVSVPSSVNVAAGEKQATFAVLAQSVSAYSTVKITGTLHGKAKTAKLQLVPPGGDVVSVRRATFNGSNHTLQISATGTNPNARLKAYDKSTGQMIGKLTNQGGGKYSMQLSWRENPGRILVKSNLGGQAVKKVIVK